jgi:hypothetical protein
MYYFAIHFSHTRHSHVNNISTLDPMSFSPQINPHVPLPTLHLFA